MMAGVHEELTLHASFASRWGVCMEGVVPSAATLAYTDFLDHTAATAQVRERVASMHVHLDMCACVHVWGRQVRMQLWPGNRTCY